MAITATPKATKLSLKYVGPTVNGKQTYVLKNYPYVKSAATNEDIYSVATAISGLQTAVLSSVIKTAESKLVEA